MQNPVLDGEQARLPTELFICIASFVDQKRDLSTLCQVSKTFMEICTPLLYSFVHIGTSEHTVETHFGLYEVLQRPSISHAVVELYVEFDNSSLCAEMRNPKNYGSCDCASHDSALGDVIRSLQNLQRLTILCNLCYECHGHEYLFELNSPALWLFKFRCYGSSAFGSDADDRSLLIAPFMSRIKALSLESWPTGYPMDWYEAVPESLLRETNALSDLHTLTHYDSQFFDFILSRCPVQRLWLVKGGRATAKAAIRRSPGRLTHLFAPDLIYWLPREMGLGIEPYSHLRFIGTIGGTCRDVSIMKLVITR